MRQHNFEAKCLKAGGILKKSRLGGLDMPIYWGFCRKKIKNVSCNGENRAIATAGSFASLRNDNQ